MDRPAVEESPVSRERHALQDLVDSPGWALVVEHFKQPATAESVLDDATRMMGTETAGTPALEMKLRQTIAACTAIREVLLFPKARLAVLNDAKEHAPDVPRGIQRELSTMPPVVRRG